MLVCIAASSLPSTIAKAGSVRDYLKSNASFAKPSGEPDAQTLRVTIRQPFVID
jgi:hypothetical protein